MQVSVPCALLLSLFHYTEKNPPCPHPFPRLGGINSVFVRFFQKKEGKKDGKAFRHPKEIHHGPCKTPAHFAFAFRFAAHARQLLRLRAEQERPGHALAVACVRRAGGLPHEPSGGRIQRHRRAGKGDRHQCHRDVQRLPHRQHAARGAGGGGRRTRDARPVLCI